MDYRELFKKYAIYVYEKAIDRTFFTEEEWNEVLKLEKEAYKQYGNE